MPKLVFYRQLRADGGIRTAIELDDETVYGLFEQGDSDLDPRLRWFVDLRCEGPKLPRSGPGARRWLLKHGRTIADGLLRCAEEVRAGMDPDVYSFSWDGFGEIPPGVRMKLVTTAARRSDALVIPEILREIASEWECLLRNLKPAEAARS